MAPRTRSISYTALNIRVHPHPPLVYRKLLDKAFGLYKSIKLRGDSFGLMLSLDPLDKDDPNSPLIGQLAKYTELEFDSWLNLETRRRAEDSEKKSIVIPVKYRPNLQIFNFYFSVRSHYLVIEFDDNDGTIAPRLISTYFEKLFKSQRIKRNFGEVEVTLAPAADQLEQIFKIDKLTRLTLTIRRPNSDGLEDLDDEILERLNNQNVSEEVIVMKAQSGRSIVPDKKTKSLSRIAQLNGEVRGIGKDATNKKVDKSTQEHPFVEVGKFSPSEKSQIDFLVSTAERVIEKIRSFARVK